MNKLIAPLKVQAATLGGISLTPKRQEKVLSLAFTFRDRTAAEKLVEWAKTSGIEASIRSTYKVFLVTAEVSE